MYVCAHVGSYLCYLFPDPCVYADVQLCVFSGVCVCVCVCVWAGQCMHVKCVLLPLLTLSLSSLHQQQACRRVRGAQEEGSMGN